MRRTVIALGAVALILGGCSRTDQTATPSPTLEPSQNTSSSPEPKRTKSKACTLLTSKDRRSIAGENIDEVVPSIPQPPSEQCRWVKSLTNPNSTSVRALTAPAQVWVTSVPSQIDALLRDGQVDGKILKQLLSARKTVLRGASKVSDEEACDMFYLLAHARGWEKGTTETASFSRHESETAETARTCSKGVFTSVSYVQADLRPSLPLSLAMLRLLRIAHKRAVKLW